MEENTNILDMDLLLIEKLADILIDIYKEKGLELVSEEVTTLDYIIENRCLPFEYEFSQMMMVFTIEYELIDRSESNILILKNNWVNRIMRHPFIENMVADSDGIEERQYIYERLEEHINFCNTEGIEIIQKRVLGLLRMEEKFVEEVDIYYNETPNFKIILRCIYNFKRELLTPIFDKFNELNHINVPIYLKHFEGSIVDEILLSERGVYDKKYGFIPTLRGFGMYLLNIGSENIKKMARNIEDIPEHIEVLLTDYVIYKLDNIDNNIEKAKAKQQALIDITPQQTLSIETTSATVENRNLVLFQREIALIYHYEGWLLIDENANDEVKKYLQKDGTRHKSGKALMADYRIVNGEFKDWLNQKVTIKYLKKIIPLLQNAKGVNDAKEDLKQAIKNKESMF